MVCFFILFYTMSHLNICSNNDEDLSVISMEWSINLNGNTIECTFKCQQYHWIIYIESKRLMYGTIWQLQWAKIKIRHFNKNDQYHFDLCPIRVAHGGNMGVTSGSYVNSSLVWLTMEDVFNNVATTHFTLINRMKCQHNCNIGFYL